MSDFTGTLTLTRFALRRDRVLIPVWVAIIVLSAVSSAAATIDLYPDAASRALAASAINNVPSLVAFYGRIWDPQSLGALSTLKLSGLVAALIGVFAIFLVVRHTRREEENGRLELLGATVVGRKAALSAAMIVMFATMLSIGVFTALGMTAAGLPAAGSWAFGLAWATTGMAYGAIAAVTAQLTISARSAVGLGIAVLGVTYVMRAIGDASGDANGSTWLSWLSPLGWGEQVRAYAGDRWWVLVLPLLFAVVVVTGAYALAARRDLGAGLLPDRAGPADAPAWLGSPLGLAWRLQRGMLLGWALGYALLGYFMGSIVSTISGMLGSPEAQQFIAKLGGTAVMTDAYLATVFGFGALISAAYGISVAMRLHAEEESGHAELILAASVSRTRWLASHVVIALAGTALLSLILGLAAAIALGLQSGSFDDAGGLVLGAVSYLPAVWVFTGLVVLIFGLLPQWSQLAWVALVACLVFGEFGTVMSLPAWVIELSPFSHIPKLPGGTFAWQPLLVVLAVAVVLHALGALSFRRRDVPA